MKSNKEDKLKIKLLNLILNGSDSGIIHFDKPLFKREWNIKSIKAVEFTEEIKDPSCINEWNAYVDSVHYAVGVKTYCVWVRETNGNMKGIIAAYDKNQKEIKLKHFHEWKDIIDKIKSLAI